MPTIIKDSNYWKEYNQKRREYLTQKERERRQKLKGVYNQEIKLEHVQPTFSEHVQPCTTILSTTKEYVQRVQLNNASCTTKECVQPVIEKVVDNNIQAYNEEVFKRAGTSEEARFYTFSDGRKIVRTKCGCDGYNWCLDNCQYFTFWRNKQINSDE